MTFPYSPVNQLPTGAATATDDPQTGTTGTLTYLREAPYLNAWIGGPSRTVQLPWITALRINCVYEDFQLVATSGTFGRQPKAGARLYTITLTRHQGVYQSLPLLIRSCYAAPQGSDIRLDRLNVDLRISYELQGTAAAIDPKNTTTQASEWWQFPNSYAAGGWDTGLITSATSASDETITFLATSMIHYAGGQNPLQITDRPSPTGGFARL
jgi:hypothetical protein